MKPSYERDSITNCLICETHFSLLKQFFMTTGLSPEKFGQLVLRKRGSMGVRAAAKEIGTSPATLSRVERGHVADMETMNKIFGWLNLDPRDFFGYKPEENAKGPEIQIMFKSKKALASNTAQALGKLIMAAHESFEKEIRAESH